jgi:hypothetical protein
MKCREVKKAMVLYLYNDLSKAESTAFEEHLRACPDCGREMEESRRVFTLMKAATREPLPQISWEKNWANIDVCLCRKEHRPFGFFPSRGWAIAAASLLFVFIIGIGIGRLLFFPSSREIVYQVGAAPGSLQSALRDHLEALKPVVVEYSNYSIDRNGGDRFEIDRDLLRALITQNQLLKQVIAEHDPTAIPLLEDLDLILKEIAVQKSRGQHDPATVKEIIDGRDVVLKMELFKKI